MNDEWELTVKPAGKGNWRPVKMTICAASPPLKFMDIVVGSRRYWVVSSKSITKAQESRAETEAR